MEKKDLKSAHYDRDAVGGRHRRRNQEETRSRRQDAQKRVRTFALTLEELHQMVQKLHTLPDPLPTLRTILGTGRMAHAFFGPSNLYPDYTGPFLFNQPHVLQHLVHLFEQGNQVAAECLTSVAGFDEPDTWVRVLIELGVVPVVLNHLENSTTSVALRVECWWMLSNITIDTSTARDLVCKSHNMVDLVQKQPLGDKEVFTEVLLFVKAIFERSPVPDSTYLAAFGNVLMQGLRHCSDNDPLITTAVGQLLKNLVRHWPVQGHQWLLSQPDLVQHVVETSKNVGLRCLFVEVLAKLCMYEPCQEQMVTQYQVVPLFMTFAVGADVNARAASLQGLRNLAQNSQCFPVLTNTEWIARFFGMFLDTDMWMVRKELFWFLTTLIAKTPEETKPSFFAFLLENRAAYYLIDCIVASTLEYDLLFNALLSVEIMLAVHASVAQIFVDTQGVEHIERLLVHESPQLRNAAERIITKHFGRV